MFETLPLELLYRKYHYEPKSRIIIPSLQHDNRLPEFNLNSLIVCCVICV